MKKILLGLIAGLVIGGAAMWFKFRPHESEKSEAGAPKTEEKPAAAGAGPALTKEQETSAGLTVASPVERSTSTNVPGSLTRCGRS